MKKAILCLMGLVLILSLAACDKDTPETSAPQDTANTESWLVSMEIKGEISKISDDTVTLKIVSASKADERDQVTSNSDNITVDLQNTPVVQVKRGAGGVEETEVAFSSLSVGDMLFVTYDTNGQIEKVTLVTY